MAFTKNGATNAPLQHLRIGCLKKGGYHETLDDPLIGCTFFACSANKQLQRQQAKSSWQHRQTEKLTRDSQSIRFFWQSDSSQYSNRVSIWPKGIFSFNPTTGFTGEAEKIVYGSLQQNQKQQGGLFQQRTSTKKTTEINSAGKSETTWVHRAVKRLGINWWWMVGGALSLVLAYLIWKFIPRCF